MLRFELLGPFRAERGGAPIPAEEWRSRQTRTVLKILLDARGGAVPFDRLADLVWPEAEGDAGRNSLQAAIRTLRRVLEPRLERGGASAYIRTEGSAYRFVPGDSAVDVDEFRAALRRASELDHRGETDAALRAYAHATSLYGGEYLADEPDADWALAPREELRAAYLDAVARLAALLERAGRPDEMIVQLERGLAADRLREDLYRLLMRGHALAGRRAHALSVFDRCRGALRAELGVEPSEETRRERERIASRQHEGSPAEAAPVRGSAAATPFVGRERELAILRQVWARASAGRAPLVLVSGDAGIGKTRLVRQFLEQLPPQTEIVTASAYESDTLSYAAVARLVESRLARIGGLRHLQGLGAYAGVLASIVPALRSAWPEAPEAPAGPADPVRALEAITQALAPSARQGVLVIALDDAQWLDAASVSWLAYALHRATGVLPVLTLRSGEATPTTLDAFCADLAHDDRIVRIEPGPLSRSEVARLVGATTDDRAGLAERLHAATSGNPLFVVEMLRGGGADERELPETIREAILARLRRCATSERELLGVLATLGDPAGAELIAAVAGRSLTETLEILDALLARRLARARDDGRYEIEHPLIQQAVYDDIVAGRRRDLHRRAAAALADGPNGRARLLLRHLTASGAPASELSAAAEQAGDEAMAAHAHADAIASYALATEHAGALGGPGARTVRARALERRAEALQAIGRSAEAVAACNELLEAVDDPLVRSRLLRKAAVYLGDAKPAESLILLDRAERGLDAREEPEARAERGQIEAARAVPLFYRSEFHAVIDAGERAMALLSGVPGADDVMGEIDLRLGSAHQRLGDLDRAAAAFRRMRARGRLGGDFVMEARADSWLGGVAQHQGRLHEALTLARESERSYERAALPRFVQSAIMNRAYALMDLGDLAASRAAYLDALERAEAVGTAYWAMHITVGLGGVEARLGLRSAARTLQRGIERADGLGTKQRKAHAILYTAELALLFGDAADACRHAETAIALGETIGDSHTLREGGAVLASSLLACGESELAAAAAARGASTARAGGFVLSEARNLVPLGQALRGTGRAAEGSRLIAQAERTFRSAGARYDLAQTLLARAAASARAAALLEEAHALAAAANARPLLGLIERARASSAGVQPTA